MLAQVLAKVLTMAALLAVVSLSWVDESAAQSQFHLSATDVTIYTPDSAQVIGHGHYNLSHVDGLDVVEGENRYLNGEYDREQQSVSPSVGGLPPVLVKYQHRYFNPDDTPQYEEFLNPRTGDASCKRYDSAVPDIRETILKEVPADTYAGATQLMLLVGRLREGAANIEFHSFNCIPDPRIIAIKAVPLSAPVAWPMYPGKLVKMEITPDLGWLNLVIAPFIPKIYAWFDPSDAFNYAGGQFDRYYKGRHVLIVRTHDANPVVQGPASPPAEQ